MRSISGQSNLNLMLPPLLTLTCDLQRNIERNRFCYYVPVNALTVVWPLTFNRVLLMPLCKAFKYTGFIQVTWLVLIFLKSSKIYNRWPLHAPPLLLRKCNHGWEKKTRQGLHFFVRFKKTCCQWLSQQYWQRETETGGVGQAGVRAVRDWRCWCVSVRVCEEKRAGGKSKVLA